MDKISYQEFIALLSEKAYLDDIPLNGSFELTPLCNLNCKMCYVHLQDPSVKQKMLTGVQWIRIIEEAINQGMFTALITGGEAMTHPDFWDIYMFLINNGISPRIKTNGLLLNESAIDRFCQYPPNLIDISLYGCDSESYVAITGVDAYEAVVRNIKNAIASGLQIRIMITPSSYMTPWFDKIFDFAKTFGVQVMVNSFLIEPNEDTGRTKDSFKLKDNENRLVDKKRKELLELLPNNLPEEELVSSSSFVSRPDVSEKGLYCNGGRTSFAINWDGTMSPCLSFPRSIALGLPIEDGFVSAWEQVNKRVKSYEVPQKCHDCIINSQCHFCPTQHSRTAGKHLCDQDICSYWEKFYAKEQPT